MCNCKKCKKKEKKISKILDVRQNSQNILSNLFFENQVKRAYIAGLPTKIYDYPSTSNVFDQYVLNIFENPGVNSLGYINTYSN